jgi:inner membrane protein
MIVGGLCAGIPVMMSVAEKRLGMSIGAHYAYPLIGVLPAIVGGLGPDIDMPNSKGGKWIRVFLKFAITISGIAVLALSVYMFAGKNGVNVKNIILPCLIFFALVCCISLLVSVAKHRRETHSGLALLILLLPNVYIVRFTEANILTNVILSIWLGFCVGWISHLLADSFNRKGVPWLYPLQNKHYHIAKVVTGSKYEYSFRIACIIVFVAAYMAILIWNIYLPAGR